MIYGERTKQRGNECSSTCAATIKCVTVGSTRRSSPRGFSLRYFYLSRNTYGRFNDNMSTLKLSMQDKKDLDKFTKFLALKAAQIIVQSRSGEKVCTKCKPNSSGTDWVSSYDPSFHLFFFFSLFHSFPSFLLRPSIEHYASTRTFARTRLFETHSRGLNNLHALFTLTTSRMRTTDLYVIMLFNRTVQLGDSRSTRRLGGGQESSVRRNSEFDDTALYRNLLENRRRRHDGFRNVESRRFTGTQRSYGKGDVYGLQQNGYTAQVVALRLEDYSGL